MNETEYKAMKAKQEGFPVKNKFFKHKVTGEYETVIPLLEMGDYEEVTE